MNFCALFLYLWLYCIHLSVLVIFWWSLYGIFYIRYHIFCKWWILLLPYQFWWLLYLFCCVVAVVRISSTMLNKKSSESGHPCFLFVCLFVLFCFVFFLTSQKSSHFFPIDDDVSYGFFICVLYYVGLLSWGFLS